jgi:flagellar hook-basal body complex protein FliE
MELERISQNINPGPVEQTSLRPAADSMNHGSTFSELLTESIEHVNHEQTMADQAIKELVSGKSKNIHETLLTIERADTSLKFMMQVRNKILDAYREIMRMQV